MYINLVVLEREPYVRFLVILQHLVHSDDPSQLSAFGVAPGLRLVINNYRTSLALFISRILVP